MTEWQTSEAMALCRLIEAVAPDYGAHVALTGGLLYKDGARKDADILLYRIRQVEFIDMLGLCEALEKIGIEIGNDYGWCVKAKYQGKPVDLFFPEHDGVDYPTAPDVMLFEDDDDDLAAPF